MLLVTSQRSSVVQCTEVSQSFVEEPASGMNVSTASIICLVTKLLKILSHIGEKYLGLFKVHLLALQFFFSARGQE
jgi:hypothetical protein